MEKTGVQSFSMPLLPVPERILKQYGSPNVGADQYIFPFLPQQLQRGTQETFQLLKKKAAIINKYLKTIQ